MHVSGSDIRPLKKKLRSEIKERRQALDISEREKRDAKICERLRHLWIYRESSVIFTYVSLDQEADTKRFIEEALKDGKKVAVPRCIYGTRNMEFCLINSLDDLEEGAFGVLEPKTSCEVYTDYSGGFCIVPALAFDRKGYRLGYGKGYYDRFLVNFCGKTAGICYNEFIVPELPRGKYDESVDLIVTEKRVISTRQEVLP